MFDTLTAGSDPPAQPEPFAREAKYLSESKVLGRDVRVMLEGVDKWGKLFGQVPLPPFAALTPQLSARELACQGLACKKTVCSLAGSEAVGSHRV